MKLFNFIWREICIIVDACVTHVTGGQPTVISSPNYPMEYPPYANCEWFIDVEVGKAVLNFQSFTFETGSSSFDYVFNPEISQCEYDFVEVCHSCVATIRLQ